MAGADWFVYSFDEMTAALKRYKVRAFDLWSTSHAKDEGNSWEDNQINRHGTCHGVRHEDIQVDNAP